MRLYPVFAPFMRIGNCLQVPGEKTDVAAVYLYEIAEQFQRSVDQPVKVSRFQVDEG